MPRPAYESRIDSAKAATVPTKAERFRSLLSRAWNSWATRSLTVGAAATVLDIGLGTSLLAFGATTRFAAMAGTALGATFTYFANRFFAFRDHQTALTQSAFRFVVITGISSVIHAQLVVWLRDNLGIPFVPAKMLADVAVFTFGQLIWLRYLVFPKAKTSVVEAPLAGEEDDELVEPSAR